MNWIALLLFPLIFICLIAALVLTLLAPIKRDRLASECLFCTPQDPQKWSPLISTQDDTAQTIDLTVVVPAYNERQRLPIMLTDALDHLQARKGLDYEILVVDDGSTDETAQVALEFGQKRLSSGGQRIRVIKLARNRGKGGAVTHGMLFARGRLIAFADADGASRFADIDKLEEAIGKVRSKDGHGIAVGSRAHMMKTAAVVQRSALRNFLMRGFHIYLYLLGVSSVKDTQAGFKLFTRKSANAIFPSMHVERWIFDVEILIIAQIRGIPVAEVPIAWQEVAGSKVSLVRDSINMALDLLIIRFQYWTGRWTLHD